VLDPNPVAGVPMVAAQGLSGLMDIALHPQFATNKYVYLSYHKAVPLPPGEPAPARASGRAARHDERAAPCWRVRCGTARR
jgi:glucose/arabinose dehydrogenase